MHSSRSTLGGQAHDGIVIIECDSSLSARLGARVRMSLVMNQRISGRACSAAFRSRLGALSCYAAIAMVAQLGSANVATAAGWTVHAFTQGSHIQISDGDTRSRERTRDTV